MTTQLSDHRSRHWRAAGQAGARLGRLATVLAAVISGLLASAAAATAAFANPVPVGDGGILPIAPAPATIRAISTGGMAGWQIALIAAGPPWPPRPRPCSWTASWPAAAAPPPDARVRTRTPRLPDDRAPGPDRQAGPRVPPVRPPANRDGRGAPSQAPIVNYSPRRVSARQSRDTPDNEEPASPRLAPGQAQATSMMPGIPAGRPAEGPHGSACHHRRRRAAGHRSGPSERAIPRNQASLRAHGFGD